MSAAATLEIRLLGEMQVIRHGTLIEFPPSKKTRALLAYLVLTGRHHRRDRLCQLLWDVADDPRGALRWSLSRLRTLVDEPGRARIHASGSGVGFEAHGARVDILDLKRRGAAGLEGAPVDELAALAGEFRGELLEGLALDDFLDFQAWCVAEREEARKLHGRILRTLVQRLEVEPEAALPHARALAAVDPLDESARAGLVRLLSATGRRREAEQHYEAACRMLKELGQRGIGELEAAWRQGRETPAFAVDALPRAAEPAAQTADAECGGNCAPSAAQCGPLAFPAAGSGLVGREAERSRLREALVAACRDRSARVLLVTGEPGVGKSRLLDEVRQAAPSCGGTVLEGRAFEAEAGRPFGPWIDALRGLPARLVSPALAGDLGTLLPELARDDRAPQSRDRLFAAVVELIAERASVAPPVIVVLDDVQWLDAASAELLHYVVRMSRYRPVVFALTARGGELHDNETARRMLRGLREMRVMEEVPLEPLGREETRDLVRAAAPEVDPEVVFAESGGNPLFALEVARALPEREGRVAGSLTEIIRGRVQRLPPEAGDVLRWAAVLGHGFDANRLGALMALDLDRLLAALELLERHALLRTRGHGQDGGYEFSHEVVRRAVYSDLSQPRRRLMHLRVAERLGQIEAAETVAAELAHHAALAGESAQAARACVRAGRRFLRQFANQDAWAMARRGHRHAAEVAEPERTALVLELLQIELQARRPVDVAAAAAELERLAERALDTGHVEQARLGFHMLAYLRWEEGDLADAQRHMMRAEMVGRAGDEGAQVVAIAEAARCLVMLERDLPRAEALALEASARSSRAGRRPSAIADAQGMLRQHQGRLAEAAELFAQARLQARGASDAMGEFQALEHLVLLRQQQADWAGARSLALELEALAGKLREGSEAPFARALLALSRRALGEDGADLALEAAVEDLRVVDAKHRLAYTLTRAARLDLGRGNARQARARAEEAYRAACVIGRPTETLLAAATLARACRALGDEAAVEAALSDLKRTDFAGAAEVARGERDELLRERQPLAS